MESIAFTELLGLALKELARTSEKPEDCWLSQKPDRLHPLMQKLARKFSHSLEPLQSLHFACAGAFPYSSELSRALDLLQQSGLIKRENPSFDRFAPTWYQDSQEVIQARTGEVFSGDEQAKREFDAFVKDLSELLEKRPDLCPTIR